MKKIQQQCISTKGNQMNEEQKDVESYWLIKLGSNSEVEWYETLEEVKTYLQTIIDEGDSIDDFVVIQGKKLSINIEVNIK